MIRSILFVCFFIFSGMSAESLDLHSGAKWIVEKHPQVEEIRQRIASIKSQIGIAKSDFYPTFDLVSQFGIDGEKTEALNNTFDNQKSDLVELQFSQKLFDGYATGTEIKKQEFRHLAEKHRFDELKNRLLLDYTEAYLRILRQKNLLALNQEQLDYYDSFSGRIQRKYDLGLGTKLEKARTESQRKLANLNYLIQSNNVEEALIEMKNFIPHFDKNDRLQKPVFVSELPASFEQARQQSLEFHPSLLVSQNNIAFAKAEVETVNSRFYPTVDLNGKYGYEDIWIGDQGKEDNYEVSIEMRLNLYSGGGDSQRKVQAKQNVMERQATYENDLIQVKDRLKLAWNAMEHNTEKIALVQQYVASRENEHNTYIENWELGRATLKDLQDAYDDVISSKRQYVNTEYDLLLAKYRVIEAMGQIEHAIGSDHDVPTVRQSKKTTMPVCFKIAAERLNVRKYPYVDSRVVGKLAQNSTVCPTQQNGAWQKIESGWIHGDYLVSMEGI